MKKLRTKIIWYFILCAFLLEIAVSLIDDIVGNFIDTCLTEDDGGKFVLLLFLFFGLTALSFAGAAFLFFILTKKAMRNDQRDELDKQSLLYSSLAHDLKTPMTSVMGFSAALCDGKIPAEKIPETAEIIRTKTKMMNELLMEMIALAKTGSSAYTLKEKKTDVCALVRAVTAMEYDCFEKKDIQLAMEIPDEPIFAMLDEIEFRRALNNIIVNAYRHNKDGARVKISVGEKKGRVKILVADDGEAIPQNLARKLFNPFVSGNESRTSGTGSGLGLAIARQIVEKHSGKIGISEDVPEYTKAFFIDIKEERK